MILRLLVLLPVDLLGERMARKSLRSRYERDMGATVYTRARFVVLRNMVNDIQYYNSAFRLTPFERKTLAIVQEQINRMLELDAKHRLSLKKWHEDTLPYRRAVMLIERFLYGKT